jgi:pimeloyl-[acyl-carrier protein] methyl ester esterase
MNLFKETCGQGGEVVLIHGWALDHRLPIANLLKDRFHVTNFDVPGCGMSDWPPKIQTIHDMADIFVPYLPKKAIYIGSSIGGCISMSIAARYPERVQRLIGIGTTPRFVETENWPGFPKPGFSTKANKIKDIGMKAFMQQIIEGEFSDFASKPSLYYELLKYFDTKVIKPEIFLKGIDILDTLDLRGEIRPLECPVDLIFGENDPYIPITVTEALRKLNPRIHSHIVANAYHLPHLTHPKEFDRLLNQILKSE